MKYACTCRLANFRPHVILAAASLSLQAAERPAAPGAPYPPSPVIAAMEWAPTKHITRVAHDGDNWPVTWAHDDALYTTK